jgi:hypothetical protein
MTIPQRYKSGDLSVPLPDWTERLLEEICESGTVTAAAAAVKVNRREVFSLRRARPDFDQMVSVALEIGLETRADKLLTAHAEIDDPQRARVYSDNLKWLLSKRLTRRYGDRLDLNVQTTGELAAALMAARARRDAERQLDADDAEIVAPAQIAQDIFA